MMDASVRSPYDSQRPSTSSSMESLQQLQQHTPGTSPAWIESASGASSHFGTLPEGTAADWQQQQQMQQPPSQTILMTGGRSMRQQLATMRLAQTAEWAAGPQGGAASSPVPASPARTPSMVSLQSEISCLSGATAFSGMSTMTGLTVRTDYSQAELDRVAQDMHLRRASVLQSPAAATPLHDSSDETEEEKFIRGEVGNAQPERVFHWLADENSKMNPHYRVYRKMVLRMYAKRDFAPPGRPGVAKMLKLLNDYYGPVMRKILEDLMADLQDCAGKDRTDTLHSLYDCASATPEALASLLRQPPRARPGRSEFSIRDIVNCVDPRGDDSVAAARILVRLAEPQLRYDDIRKRGITDDGLRRLLAAVLHEKDVAPNKRIVLIEALKKYNKKSEFLDKGGVSAILRFLDKEADEKGVPVPESVTLVRVEKEEPLLHHVLCFLRSLVVARRRGTDSSRRDAFVADMAKHNGVQILSGWLDHGSSRLLCEIAQILGALSTSRQLVGKDLSVAIRHVIQLLGADDSTFANYLVTFVKNVAQLSTAHKRSAIDSGACAEMLQLLNKWAVATERGTAHDRRWFIPTLYAAVETLDVLTETDAQSAHVAALDALLKLKDAAVPVLLRIASFDFVYTDIKSMDNAEAKNRAFDAQFDALSPDARMLELRTKYYALNVLQRLCMRAAPNLGPLGLASVKDPLHGESLIVLLWRLMWGMYRQVFVLSSKPPSSAARPWRPDDFAPVISTIRTATYLATILYGDPACLSQVLELVGVAREAPDGAQPMLNPFTMLSTNLPQLTSAVFTHVDAIATNFRRLGLKTHKHPMAVWLQPRARADNGDYKDDFFKAIHVCKANNCISVDLEQRLYNYFNECMGTHSPSFTPGGFKQEPHAIYHHHAYPQLMPHHGYQQ